MQNSACLEGGSEKALEWSAVMESIWFVVKVLEYEKILV